MLDIKNLVTYFTEVHVTTITNVRELHQKDILKCIKLTKNAFELPEAEVDFLDISVSNHYLPLTASSRNFVISSRSFEVTAVANWKYPGSSSNDL